MSQYHRHFDREWSAFRRETNYALTGNARGRTVAGSASHTTASREWRRAEWLWTMHCVAEVRGDAQRAQDVAWLRFKEAEC